jgi:endogenous inhibitor of DNA gyrase (YacG/DUF329 family)
MSSGKPFGGNGHNGNGHKGKTPGAVHALPKVKAKPVAAPKSAGRQIKCPQCGKMASWTGNPSRPFCSERCRLMDLGKWADGTHAIPGEKVPDKDPEE